MKISPKQYAAALFESLLDVDDKDVSQIVKKFAALLRTNNESYKLGRIVKEFDGLWNKNFSVIEAEISSAREINEETEQALKLYIRKSLKVKNIVVSKKIDAAVLGGVVVKYGDKIFDASLKSKLESLKASIAK